MPHSHVSASVVFFFNDTATTEIYTLSLHDALPISPVRLGLDLVHRPRVLRAIPLEEGLHEDRNVVAPVAQRRQDRKSTRLNSSHANISYAVFCLKKKLHSGKFDATTCADLDTCSKR